MESLTEKQERVLQFIITFVRKNGVPPTIREIMKGLGFSSPRPVQDHLKILTRKGYLTVKGKASRGIELSRQLIDIPVLGRVGAGKVAAERDIEGYIDVSRILTASDELFGLRVKGDSMLRAGIHEKDIVVVRKQPFADPGDLVVVIGCTGGVGVYVTQMAKAFGADVVIGIARNPEKLKRALQYGADFVINSTDKGPRDIRNEFRKICKENSLPTYGWKIFEVTGTRPGQDMALELLSFIGKLIVVGFGLAKNEYSISRLMAFDAEIIGTWGCLPEYYPIVLNMVLKGKIQIEPFVETRPMSRIAEVFEEVHKAGSPARRIVLVPDF